MAQATYDLGGSDRTPYSGTTGELTSEWAVPTSSAPLTGKFGDTTSRPCLLSNLSMNFAANTTFGTSGGSINMIIADNRGGTTAVYTSNAATATGGNTVSRQMAKTVMAGDTVYYGFKKNDTTRTIWYRNTSGTGIFANGTALNFGTAASPNTAATQQARITRQTVPGAPGSVSGSASGTSVTVGWSAPSDTGGSAITGYRIAMKNMTDAGSVWEQVTTTASTATSYTKTGLTAGKSYRFAVSAYNAVTTAHSGATISLDSHTGTNAFTTDVAIVKPVVAATATISSSSITSTSATITWSTGNEPTTVTVSGPNWTGSNLASGSADITGLSAETKYTYTIVASNSASPNPNTAGTATVEIKTLKPKPTMTITATALTATTARLVWSTTDASAAAVTGDGIVSTDEKFKTTSGNEIITGLTRNTIYRWNGTASNTDQSTTAQSNSIQTLNIISGVWDGSGKWAFPTVKVYNNGNANWSDAPAGVTKVWDGQTWQPWS